jgi:hypothetical protein
MLFKDFVNALGDFFLWTFEILPVAGNLPNIFFSLIIAVLFFYWMAQMAGHARKRER